MARLAGKNANLSFNAVALEDELATIDFTVDNNLAEVTAFSDDGAEFVEGLPNTKLSGSGAADFANGQGDATIFGQIGQGEAAYVFQPTGQAAAADNPNYGGNAMVASYKITADVGGAVTYSVDLQTNGKPVRSVA